MWKKRENCLGKRKLAECRQELQAVADSEIKVMKSKVMNGIGSFEKDEPFENTANIENETESVDSESAASEKERMESIADSVENMLETGEQTRDDAEQRIENIERKLSDIIKRMDKKENVGKYL